MRRRPFFLILVLAILVIFSIHCDSQRKAAEGLRQRGQLTPLRTVESSIRRGEVQRFELNLAKGQFVRIVVEQKKIDLELILRDSAGTPLKTIDHPTGTDGPEWLSLIADVDSQLLIDVQPWSRGSSSTGAFRLEVLEMRPTQPGDAARVEAENAILDAYQSNSLDLPSVIAKYEKGLLFFLNRKEHFDRQICAAIHAKLGLLNYDRGDLTTDDSYFEEAIYHHQAEADIYISPKNDYERGRLALASGEIGKNYHRLKQYGVAMQQYFESILLTLDLDQRRRLLELFQRVALACEAEQRYSLAKQFMDLAGHYYDKNLSPVVKSQFHNNFGFIYQSIGNKKEAFTSFSRSTERDIGNVEGAAVAWINLGTYFADRLDGRMALISAQKALGIAEKVGKPHLIGLGLVTLSRAHTLLDDLPCALDDLNRASLLDPEQPIIHLQMGITRQRIWNQFPEQEKANPEMLLLAMADFKTALALTPRNAWLVTRIDLQRARVQHILNTRFVGDSTVTSKASHTAPDPIELLNRSLLTMQAQTLTAADIHSRAMFFEFKDYYLYQTKIWMLLDRARREGSSQAMETAIAQAFSTFDACQAFQLRQHMTDSLPNTATAPQILEQFQAVQIKGATPRILAQKAQALRQSLITNAKPVKIDEDPTLGLNAYQAVLDDDTLVLAYNLNGGHEPGVWIISRHAIAYQTLKLDELTDPLDQAIQTVVAGWQNREMKENTAAVGELSRVLLAPILPFAKEDTRRLALISDGPLQALPINALYLPPEGSQYEAEPGAPPIAPRRVIDRFEVVTVPSLSVLAARRNQTRSPTARPRDIIIFANPEFKQHPALPFSQAESDRIAGWFAPDTCHRFHGRQATRARVLADQTCRANYLHFATHGIMDPERPGDSFLVLAGRDQDDGLYLRDIIELELQAELVTLSSCETAAGKSILGEGLISLARGFMYAGAPRVVGSLWQVPDFSTALLMNHFYRFMIEDGHTSATALRLAQLELRKEAEWYAPHHWAGFTFIGDWR